jgi:hypothetical protein
MGWLTGDEGGGGEVAGWRAHARHGYPHLVPDTKTLYKDLILRPNVSVFVPQYLKTAQAVLVSKYNK